MTEHWKNTSRYADAELRAMFEFARSWVDVDTKSIAVNIKNLGRGGHRGRAYLGGVPIQSPWRKVKGIDGLCILAIGKPDQFPSDNLMTFRRKRIITDWIPGTPMPDEPKVVLTKDGPLTLYPGYRVGFPETLHWELKHLNEYDEWRPTARRVPGGIESHWMYRLYHEKVERLPYGGKGSRYYKCMDWREGFVSVAAHELQHFRQRANKKRYSEVECEQVAGMVLDAYRKAIGTIVSADGKTLIKRGVFSASLLNDKGAKGIQVPVTRKRGSQATTARVRATRKGVEES